jgi:TonB family protein
MSGWRAQDASLGIGLSLLAHLGVLLVVGDWLDRAAFRPSDRPLAVAIWTEPEPPDEPEEPAEDVSARTVETAEPAPAEVEADEPPEPLTETLPAESETNEPAPESSEDAEAAEESSEMETPPEPVVIPDPPSETLRPELPELGRPSFEVDLPISPLAGILDHPPEGPGDEDRGRLLGERLTASARRAAERSARLEGRASSRAALGLEREADTLMVPAGDTPLASEKGVVGPLGSRHILYSETPEYPAWARRLGLEAQVRFRIWVTPEGIVNRVEVLERSGSTDLDALAARALRRWRFQPLPRGATARDEWGEVPMTFTLVAD